jgi:hypothetical protein
MSDRLKKLLAQILPFKRRMIQMHQQVVEFVAENLEQRAWNQQDLAREMGVNPASLSRSLSYHGTANLTLETIAKIEVPFGKNIFARRVEVLDELKHDPKSLSQIVFSAFEIDDRNELLGRISNDERVKNAVLLGIFDGSKTLKIVGGGDLFFKYSLKDRTKETHRREFIKLSEPETVTIPS